MAEVGIFVGTMYGNSLLVAEEAEAILTSQGHKATVYEDPELADWEKYKDKYILVVTSTTGQGDLPDSIVPLFQGIKDRLGYQPDVHYGIISSRTFTTALLPLAIALTPTSAAAASSSMRFFRNRAPSASARCC